MPGLLALALTAAQAVERLPIEDFSREPTTARAQLSPDGKRLAFIREDLGKPALHIADIDQKQVSRLDLGEATAPVLHVGGNVIMAQTISKQVGSFAWVSDRRLVITTVIWDTLVYGVIATNWDGSQGVPISGLEDNQINISIPKQYYNEIIHCFYDKDQTVLMLDRHVGSVGLPNRPDILRVDTMTGLAGVVVKNPGEVAMWSVDANGVARLGILSHGELSGAIYRENEASPWKTILPLANRTGQMRAVGIDAATGLPLVGALTPEKRWTIFPLDPATGTMGAPLLADPEYDIVPNRPGPQVAGIELAATIFSPKKGTLLGIRYYTDAPRVKWFDRDFATYQAALDRALPDTVNVFVNASLDGRRMLWLAFSDQDPGTYMLLDLDKHKLTPLAPRMSWIKPAQMAPMLSVKYQARDGITIHGFLTVPVGHQPKDLPLVVMPHGGPWVRDAWGFDPLVQLLANRGYAVLQMNYRGSPGYGEELFEKAHRQIGKAIQDDIEDATRWAIAAGVADPKHIAIMGASYGGYSTLFALGHNPELYRCGISQAGVSDWPAIYNERGGDSAANDANRYWRREIGDPDKDLESLKAISPVNFADRITAPILIIQGKDDHIVPRGQAKLMISALEKTGRTPESLFISDLGHTFGNARQRQQIYQAIDAFLAKNLGPGVP
jgi:dipeptidyl aminopeptidase/acylaminoacyl peptidase